MAASRQASQPNPSQPIRLHSNRCRGAHRRCSRAAVSRLASARVTPHQSARRRLPPARALHTLARFGAGIHDGLSCCMRRADGRNVRSRAACHMLLHAACCVRYIVLFYLDPLPSRPSPSYAVSVFRFGLRYLPTYHASRDVPAVTGLVVADCSSGRSCCRPPSGSCGVSRTSENTALCNRRQAACNMQQATACGVSYKVKSSHRAHRSEALSSAAP